MKDYTILVPDKTKYTFKFINFTSSKLYNVYKIPNLNIILRILRKMIYFIGCGISNMFYDNWTRYLGQDTQFIVFDACRPYHRLLRKLKQAKNRPIVYFWNPITSHDKIEKLKKYFDVYSYSLTDCKKYDLKFNPTFYVDIPVKTVEDMQYDTIFIGKNKGRLSQLESVYSWFKNPLFYVTKDKQENSKILLLQNTPMDYREYLEKLSVSTSILEILISDNADYSLRTMEAIFFQKKLITNNKEIRKAFFYKHSNIYVIDEQTTKEKVQEFLKEEFVPYTDFERNYFSVDCWLDRFVKNE